MTESREEYEHRMRLWEGDLVWKAQAATAHISALASFASLAINSIILANSASAGAVLALLAATWNSPSVGVIADPAVRSVSVFAGGILAAIVCAALSYLTQHFYGTADDCPEESRQRANWLRVARSVHILAVIAGLAGIASFGVGAFEGVTALEAARDTLGASAQPPSPGS